MYIDRIRSVNMKQFSTRGFFSGSGRIFFHAPIIKFARKLAHYKQEVPVFTALPIVKVR